MKTLDTDVAIIGSGTAALNALREVEKAGGSWLLIESGPYGTMCARTGCMPSKLLIAAAEASHTIDQATAFGIQVKDKIINGLLYLSEYVQSVIVLQDLWLKALKRDLINSEYTGTQNLLGPLHFKSMITPSLMHNQL